jgi:acetolactate synthase small subunit
LQYSGFCDNITDLKFVYGFRLIQNKGSGSGSFMRHVISVLLQNEVGALTRMTGLFSSRGYNIDSLNVAPTDDPLVSRVTLVIEGSDAAIAQLNTQLAKLVDVVNIHDMTLGEHFEGELAIVKMKLQTGGGQLHRSTHRPAVGSRRFYSCGSRIRGYIGSRPQRKRRCLQGRGDVVVIC